ncbi:MAG: DUF4153 domain-containing protein [Tissierellia bacterium]|nr:DUF4153 domain-containing protein [Tissierellia bacterium]
MRFRERIASTLYSMRNSVKRFPITVIVSILFVIVQIYINEQGYPSNDIREIYNKISMTIGLAIPLSLCLGFINEVFFNKDKIKQGLTYVIGVIFLVLYYMFFLKEINTLAVIRYTGTMIFLLIGIFYMLRLRNKENYEFHVLSINYSIAITFIYSAVLYMGIIFILFTIDQLFDANIDGKYYFYTFLIVTFIFGVSLFISKLDKINEDYKDYDYSNALKILLIYIVIPLISIYTLILYVYFAKIIVTWEWPKGLVSHLVLWYSTLSVFIIFLITPILEENKIARLFKIWFPKLVLPILLMMFMSIYQRLDQYGFTENRYFVIVLGMWVTGIMVYFSLVKPLRNIIIPITLSLVVLNSVYGPLSAFNVSINSQNNRLNKFLTTNGFLLDGELIKKDQVSQVQQREISNIVEYFKNREMVDKIKIFPDDFKTEEMQDILGFAFKPDIYGGYISEDYFNYYLDPYEISLDIEAYDYYVYMATWSNRSSKISDLELIYEEKNNSLKLFKGEILLFEEDIKSLVLTLHNKLKDNIDNQKEGVKLEDMIIQKDYESVKIKIIFNNISGRNPYENNKISLDGAEFIILIDIK